LLPPPAPRCASAATGTLGTLAFVPSSGNATDGFSVSTVSSGSAKGCPAGTTVAIGKMVGPGWSVDDSIDAFAQPVAGLSTTADFSVPMVNNMAAIATSHGLSLVVGTYAITVTCQSPSGAAGTFVGEFTFSTPTAWSAVASTSTSSTSTSTSTSGTSTSTSTSGTSTSTSTSGTSTSTSTSGTSTSTSTSSGSATPSTGAPTGTLGTLTVNPATGSDIDPLDLNTHASGSTKGCPSAATNVNGFITGPGDWTVAKSIQAFSNTTVTALVSQSDPPELQIPTSNSMSVIASNYSLKIVPGRYDFTVICQNPLGTTKYGTFIGSIWFTDATHFQSKDPATSQSETTITVVVTPQYRADVGDQVSLTATVSPATAVGKVQFQESTNGAFAPIGSPIDVASGTAALKISTLPFGLHTLSAVFTPTDAKAFKAATSADQAYVVALPIPPSPPSGATVSGTAKVGSTLTCSASFQNATSTAFAWLRNRSTISGAASSSYRLVAADKGTAVQCKAMGTNSGGTTFRISKSVAVS